MPESVSGRLRSRRFFLLYTPDATTLPNEALPGLEGRACAVRGRIPKEQIELLKTVPIFSVCSQKELRTVAQLGMTVEAEAGAALTTRGMPGREFFLVLEGVASCRMGRREVRRFGPGDFFGEMAILYGGVRTADVVATSEMRLLVLDSREFRSMLMTTPLIGTKMLANLAERLSEADDAYTN
jgi:CRP/FNR family cyclic AMP-dependent transcriptional regulator